MDCTSERGQLTGTATEHVLHSPINAIPYWLIRLEMHAFQSLIKSTIFEHFVSIISPLQIRCIYLQTPKNVCFSLSSLRLADPRTTEEDRRQISSVRDLGSQIPSILWCVWHVMHVSTQTSCYNAHLTPSLPPSSYITSLGRHPQWLQISHTPWLSTKKEFYSLWWSRLESCAAWCVTWPEELFRLFYASSTWSGRHFKVVMLLFEISWCIKHWTLLEAWLNQLNHISLFILPQWLVWAYCR